MLFNLNKEGVRIIDIRSFLAPKKKKQPYFIFKKLKVIVLLSLFVLVEFAFKETYAIYTTLARTPVAEAGTIGEILEVKGEFDALSWLDSGASGLMINNISQSKIWVYFKIEGELIQAIQHIDAVCLEPGQIYEIPIIPANTPPIKANGQINELGLLGWRNNNQEFSGRIIAGVLNGYAGYEIGTVTIKGHDVYESFVREKENGKALMAPMREEDSKQELTSANSLNEIQSINDILLLIANKIALLKERDDLLVQVDRLIQENDELIKENSRLKRRVNSLEADVESLHRSLEGTKKQLDELQNPPAEDPSQSSSDQGSKENPESGNDKKADREKTDTEDSSSSGLGNNSGTEAASGTNSSGQSIEKPETAPDNNHDFSSSSEPAGKQSASQATTGEDGE